MAKHDERGFEIPDPQPVEMPLGFRKPQSLHELIQSALRSQAIQHAQHQRGEETLDDALDFDVPGEDPDAPLPTMHEAKAMVEEVLDEGRHEKLRSERAERLKPKAAAAPVTPPAPPEEKAAK